MKKKSGYKKPVCPSPCSKELSFSHNNNGFMTAQTESEFIDFASSLWNDDPKTPWQEECGIVGAWAPQQNVSELCYLSLFALQHRGQEAAGIAVTDGMHIDQVKGPGLMREAFKDRMPHLDGHLAVGHVRYSSYKSNKFSDIQPSLAYYSGGLICVAHNGKLANTFTLQKEMAAEKRVPQNNSDTETILNLIVSSDAPNIEEKILNSLRRLKGAYCLAIMTGDTLVGARDPRGFRPLALGQTNEGSYILASETCALDAVNAKFIRDIEAGEMIVIDSEGLRSHTISKSEKLSSCVFEYVYFSRPDSIFDGLSVWQARYRMGRELAKEFKGEADIVTPVPDTGIAAALGFAAESGIQYVEGLIKNRYIGRSFIMPDHASRKATVEMKLNLIKANLKGKKVALVDDSIVRGTTSARLISLIRKAEAKEVHFCISSPPITHPCLYGIDTAVKNELIAASSSVEEIKTKLGADGLCYLSRRGLMEAVYDSKEERMCTACFSGEYPCEIEGE